jgi:molecular chaperone HtpG
MADTLDTAPATETHAFQAEVGRLLDIVANALYSEREIFLRELISNAADASDRLRYLAATDTTIGIDTSNARILITPDLAADTLTVADDGIGMDRTELVDNLGTIARSGTGRFMAELSGDQKRDLGLIGQFGVGFYAAFMVADQVTVTSRKVGADEAWTWSSDGRGGFQIALGERARVGTTVTLHLKADAREFLEPERIEAVVRRYSDHVPLPIQLADKDGERRINEGSALWTRPRAEITDEAATSFYRHVAHAADTPWATIHQRAEGAVEFAALMFVPTQRPFDLFHPERRHGLRLYVRRVFITDEAKDLIPGYLRFLRGVVDTPDLPLNISRELLQANPLIHKIRQNLTRRTLAEIERKADADPGGYLAFWAEFGAVMKEGLYEDQDNRALLLKLARFRSSARPGWVSLADYLASMKPGQEAIYTASGDNPDALAASPQLEGFRARGLEVLLLSEPIDEFWAPAVGAFEGKPFKSVTRGAIDLADIPLAAPEGEAPPTEAPVGDDRLAALIALFKLTLGEQVKDVRASDRLTDSAACLVADEFGLDLRLERMLRQHKQLDRESPRILEINPRHATIRSLAARAGETGAADHLADAVWLLLEQARIVEGEPPTDPRAFARRLEKVIAG